MIERKIIIGLITSTEYCEKIKDVWNAQLIASGAAKLIASWAWDYYNRYKEAPGKEIETIYYTKIKENKLQKGLAEEIEEDILPGLSAEYENTEFNLQYLLEETDKYFSERRLNILASNVQALIAEGKIEDATEMVTKFRLESNVAEGLDDFIRTVDQIREENKPHPITLMKPWLKEGQTTIIYGNYGSGKSLLVITVAYLLGMREYDGDECEIGTWIVKNQTGTLYVDGELGEQEMEDRIKKFEWLGSQKHKIQVLSIPEYQLSTEDTFYLSDRKNQQKIIKWLKEHPRYKLIVLDSASTLFGLENENDNSEWNNKVNPFLRDLRALGVACILLHHAGKDNKRGLRGASAMGAMAHNIFRLTNHEDKDDGEAWCKISKDKQRAGGFGFKDFSLHFFQNETETETHWEIT